MLLSETEQGCLTEVWLEYADWLDYLDWSTKAQLKLDEPSRSEK